MKKLILIILLSSFAFSLELKLNNYEAEKIAHKIWMNEGAGKHKYLVWWNKGEEFASCGIGHFIWFPKGHKEKFREVFPMVVAYMEKRKVKMPSWLNSKTALPWATKSAFFKAKKERSRQYTELFNFLKSTMSYQASFMAERLANALPQMLNTIDDPEKKALIKKRFNEVLYDRNGKVSQRGLYVLLDYTNFKGEGTLKSERYKGGV